MRLQIKSDLKQLERTLGRAQKDVIKKAAPPAINRVTKTVASVAVKGIAGETGLKQKDVRKGIRTKLARRKDLTAYVDAKEGRAVTLRRFITPARRAMGLPGKPQFFRRKKGRKGKRTYKYKGIEHKAWNRKKVLPGSFMGKARGGNVLPLLRLGAGRNAQLKVLRGPSVRREFDREPMRNKMIAKANERFPIEIARTIDRELARLKSKG